VGKKLFLIITTHTKSVVHSFIYKGYSRGVVVVHCNSNLL